MNFQNLQVINLGIKDIGHAYGISDDLRDFIHGLKSEATICIVPKAREIDHAYGISIDLRYIFHGIKSEATICIVPMARMMDHAYGILVGLTSSHPRIKIRGYNMHNAYGTRHGPCLRHSK